MPQSDFTQTETLNTPASASELADVLVPRRVAAAFTYRLPAHLRAKIMIGSRVLVPLGSTIVDGIVVAFPTSAPQPAKGRKRVALRDIQSIAPVPLDGLPLHVLDLTRWLAVRYVALWGQCLRMVLPSTPPTRSRARNAAPDSYAVFSSSIPTCPVGLPEAWAKLDDALRTQRHTAFLLQGSPRERHHALFEAISLVLAQQRSALLVVPEIGRAISLADAARKEWGTRVGLWHGSLSVADRALLWQQSKSGSVRVVIGTRSAVFLPLSDLGLVCVEDEDDYALKEEQEPRYHAREVAEWRARQERAALVLGTAHPSLDMSARDDVERLVFRKTDSHLSSLSVTTIDIRHRPYGVILSEAMLNGIRSAIEARTGALLFLNRKGFAPALQCRACGQTPQCTNCTVTLTYYRRARHLMCHYCGTAYPIPDACPACGGILLQPSGFGTEQLEEEVRLRFPDARIARLDTDSTPRPAQAEKIRQAMAAGEIDVLIGTQLLFQGTALPLVGFVGMPHADAGLHRPDFRAAERTYASLLDAVSLALPAADGGAVVLQTYLPTHHVIEAITKGEPARFYEPELACRQALGYPPFTHLIHLGISGKEESPVRKAAHKWAEAIAAESAHDPSLAASLTIMGPIAAPIARRRGRHRWQILVKSDRAEWARDVVRVSREALEAKLGRGRIKLDVDVDPVELS